MKTFTIINGHSGRFIHLTYDHVAVAIQWTENMCRREYWDLSGAEMAKLVGCSNLDAYVLLKQKLSKRDSVEVEECVLERISLLLGVWENLQLIVPENRKDLAGELFNSPIRQLEGKSVRGYLLERNDTKPFYLVNRILGGMHC
jgi:hypothetical protein